MPRSEAHEHAAGAAASAAGDLRDRHSSPGATRVPWCFVQGSLKETFCNYLKHVAFFQQIKGNHHLQGNVQVYNVRIPVVPPGFRELNKNQKVMLVFVCVSRMAKRWPVLGSGF